MASQSLYRKWRSQTFQELIGQEHVIQTLRNAIVEDRVAHAYLFTGPRGVGKTSVARLLSKAVNCSAAPAQRPCGVCAACVSISEGRAVDVIEMDAASHTSVEDAREIIERVQFRPSELNYKVYTVDECHMLSTAAFNALLKTLEEPPDHAIFILATTEVHKVPATILSRCQRFTFTRHSITSTSNHLRSIAAAESLTLDTGVAEAIARSATGSMRDALSVLEQLASFGSGHISLDQVHSLLGMTAAAEVNALIEALLAADAGAALRAVASVAEQGADLRQFTRDLVERLRIVMLIAAGGERDLLDVSDDELALYQSWASMTDAPTLLHYVKILSNLDYQLRTSPYGQLPLELAIVEALTQQPQVAAPVAVRPAAASPQRSNVRTFERSNVQAPKPAPPAPQRAAAPTQETTSASATAPNVQTPEPIEGAPTQETIGTPPTTPNVQTLKRSNVQTPDHANVPTQATAAANVQIPDHAEVTPAQDDTNEPEADPATDASLIEHASAETFERLNAPTFERSTAALAANAEISQLERIEAQWNNVVRDVRPRDKMLQAILRDVRPVDVEGNTLILLANSTFHQTQIEKPINRQIIEEILSKLLGTPFAVRCTTETRAEVRDLRGQIRQARKDPLVKAAINIFDADVIGIEEEQ